MDQLSRRDLLKRALQGGLGLAALSTLQLTAMSKALAAQSAPVSGSKALVCVFLFGGNDSANMLVPLAGDSLTAYLQARQSLAVSGALPISPRTAVADGIGAGPRYVVALSVGAREGIRNGHTFSVWSEGAVRPDRIANRSAFMANRDTVEMPDDFLGHVMVFRTFDKVSYALVMDGIRPVHHGDLLKHPDASE